jgi:hypothetical protein
MKNTYTSVSAGTKLGRDAIETAIAYVKEQKALGMSALTWSDGLALNAKILCEDISKMSSDELEDGHAHVNWRKYGIATGKGMNHFMGESTGFGEMKGRAMVKDMLIDEGSDGREERQNLYNSRFRYTGVGVCPHPKFGKMTVVTYAENFTEDNSTRQGKDAIR